MYLRYVIGGGDLNIDFAKIDTTMKWIVPTNVSKVGSFFWVSTMHNKIHSLIFSGGSNTPQHRNEYYEFLVGKGSIKNL